MNSVRKIKKIYCFDTSAFLALSRTSENVIKIPTTVWEQLDKMMKLETVISHKLVYEEICGNPKNKDFITSWIMSRKKYFIGKNDIQRAQIPKIVSKHPKLLDYEREREQADPWIIALAIEKSKENTLFETCISVVVNQENPNSSKKIPAACRSFGIEHLLLRGFFDEMGLSTSLKKTAR